MRETPSVRWISIPREDLTQLWGGHQFKFVCFGLLCSTGEVRVLSEFFGVISPGTWPILATSPGLLEAPLNIALSRDEWASLELHRKVTARHQIEAFVLWQHVEGSGVFPPPPRRAAFLYFFLGLGGLVGWLVGWFRQPSIFDGSRNIYMARLCSSRRRSELLEFTYCMLFSGWLWRSWFLNMQSLIVSLEGRIVIVPMELAADTEV